MQYQKVLLLLTITVLAMVYFFCREKPHRLKLLVSTTIYAFLLAMPLPYLLLWIPFNWIIVFYAVAVGFSFVIIEIILSNIESLKLEKMERLDGVSVIASDTAQEKGPEAIVPKAKAAAVKEAGGQISLAEIEPIEFNQDIITVEEAMSRIAAAEQEASAGADNIHVSEFIFSEAEPVKEIAAEAVLPETETDAGTEDVEPIGGSSLQAEEPGDTEISAADEAVIPVAAGEENDLPELTLPQAEPVEETAAEAVLPETETDAGTEDVEPMGGGSLQAEEPGDTEISAADEAVIPAAAGEENDLSELTLPQAEPVEETVAEAVLPETETDAGTEDVEPMGGSSLQAEEPGDTEISAADEAVMPAAAGEENDLPELTLPQAEPVEETAAEAVLPEPETDAGTEDDIIYGSTQSEYVEIDLEADVPNVARAEIEPVLQMSDEEVLDIEYMIEAAFKAKFRDDYTAAIKIFEQVLEQDPSELIRQLIIDDIEVMLQKIS